MKVSTTYFRIGPGTRGNDLSAAILPIERALYLLDTNIVSLFDQRRREQVTSLIDWMRRNDQFLFLSVVTLAEIEAGILKLRRDAKIKRAGELEVLRVQRQPKPTDSPC